MAIVIYTDRFVPDGSAGCARGPLIFIRPEYADDRGLLEHEKIHVLQWLRTCGLHSLLYLCSKSYRLKSEVEAYRKQLNYCPDDKRALFAKFIAEDYRLSVSESEAFDLLS